MHRKTLIHYNCNTMSSKSFSSLHQRIAKFALKKEPIDFEFVCKTLENTTETVIVSLCFEALYSNRSEIIAAIQEKLSNSPTEALSYAFIFVCSLEPDFQAMSILIHHYITQDTYKALIFKQGFTDKKLVALSLMEWLEHHSPNTEESHTVKALCASIPREALLGLPKFSHSKLCEYYFKL